MRKSTDSGVKWAECSLIIGTGCRVQVFSLILVSSVGLSASIQSAGDLVSGTPGSNPAFCRGTQLVSFRFCWRFGVWDPGFKACILPRNTTCLLSIWISLACARASKLTTTNMYIARARCESQLTVGSSGLNARWSQGRAVEFKFLAWSSIAQSVSREHSVCWRFSVWDPGFQSCILQRNTTCLLSIWISLACARASKLTTTNMYIARARCEGQLTMGSSGLNARWW